MPGGLVKKTDDILKRTALCTLGKLSDTVKGELIREEIAYLQKALAESNSDSVRILITQVCLLKEKIKKG